MSYTPRWVDLELDELAELPAVAVEGAKGVGKTFTASRRAATVLRLDDPDQRALLEADPERLARVEGPVLVDEWERLPRVWDLVRRAVDDGAPSGRYLLTGSATPPPDVDIHSGAGRIVPVRMRPMALTERGNLAPTVSLGGLLGPGVASISGACDVPLSGYVEEICATGLPGLRSGSQRAREASVDGYLARVIDREVPDLGIGLRRPAALRAWLAAYAAATSTTSTYATILAAATPGDGDQPVRKTAEAYRDLLTRIWLLDPLPGWIPVSAPLRRLQVAPKHHIADPGLAAALLGASPDSLLDGQGRTLAGGSLLPALFESIAALTVRVAAQVHRARVMHCRTRNGDHEIDLIVENRDGSVVGIEVKLGLSASDADVRHLVWLRDQLGTRVRDLVVITAGREAYRRRDGIAVVPLALLGP